MDLKTIIKPLKLWLVQLMKDNVPQYKSRPGLYEEAAWGLALAMYMKCSEIGYAEIIGNITEVKGKAVRTSERTKIIMKILAGNRAGLLKRLSNGKVTTFQFNIMTSLEILAAADKAESAQLAEAKTDAIEVPA